MKKWKELTTEEIRQIDRGDWLEKAGAMAHRAWCKTKHALNEFAQYVGEKELERPYIW